MRKAWELLEKFPIGTKVRVTKKFLINKSYKTRKVYTIFVSAFDAIVTGAKYLRSGRIEGSYEHGRYFEATDTHVALLVRWGYTNAEIACPDDGVEVINDFDFPVRYSGHWSESEKREMSKIAKRIPRDSRGRFMPGPLLDG